MQTIMDAFPYWHRPLAPMSEASFESLVERCKDKHAVLVDWTAMSGGITTVSDLNRIKNEVVASKDIRLDGLVEVKAILTENDYEKLVTEALHRFVAVGHPDAELHISTILERAHTRLGPFRFFLAASKCRLKVAFWIDDETENWILQLAKAFDPSATLIRKENRLFAVSPSGTNFYHFHNIQAGGNLCFFGLDFEQSQIGGALSSYRRVCDDPLFKRKVAKIDGMRTRVKCSRYWTIDFSSNRPGKSVARDDIRLMEELVLPLREGEIAFSWSLVNWHCWRALRQVPVELKDDMDRGSALFSFECPSGNSALLEVMVGSGEKFSPRLRFADESDSSYVYRMLGLKRRE